MVSVVSFIKNKTLLAKNNYNTTVSFSLVSLAACLITLALLNFCIAKDLQAILIYQNPFPQFQIAPYPTLSSTIHPTISAESAMIIEKSSQAVLYEKNSELRFSPASTTKIMTALVALEYFRPTDVITIKRVIDSEGSGLNFSLGEQLQAKDILQAALIYSANDAAVAIAQNYPGGETAFVSAMNAKAKKLHLWNTHFGDSDGLDDTYNYTTAKELATIATTAMQNGLIRDIVGTKETTITNSAGTHSYTIKNRNILLGVAGITGIKTGYTQEAGEVLATSVIKNGHTFYIIVMKSNNRFADTVELVHLLSTVTFVSMYQ